MPKKLTRNLVRKVKGKKKISKTQDMKEDENNLEDHICDEVNPVASTSSL